MSDEALSAIVLGSTDIGEADRLVKLLTRERGLLTAKARGARRSRKRYGGRLDRYALVRARVQRRRGRSTLGDVDLLRPFLGIRGDLLRTAMADHLLELVRLVAREEEPAAPLFGLLLQALDVLDHGPTPDEGWLRAAVMRALTLAGYGLALDACVGCGEAPTRFPVAFSPAAGGLLCAAHAHEDPGARSLSRGDLEVLRRLASADLGDPASAALPAAAARRARAALARFAEYHLERRLRTTAFVDELLDGNR